MRMTDEEETVIYTTVDVAEITERESSTPDENWLSTEAKRDRRRVLESINFDGPTPVWTFNREEADTRESTSNRLKGAAKSWEDVGQPSVKMDARESTGARAKEPIQHVSHFPVKKDSCDDERMTRRTNRHSSEEAYDWDHTNDRRHRSLRFLQDAGRFPSEADGRRKTGDQRRTLPKLPRDDGHVAERKNDREEDAESALSERLLERLGGLLRSRPAPMKPGRFDGTGSLESLLSQFEVCARHNRWTNSGKTDYLRCSLEKAATQLLWDFGSRQDVSYEELVGRLRQRYGTEGQAETFRAQLYYRRQRAEENLSDLLHDIRRLVVLAYPVPTNETTEIIAKDAFIEALRDRELALKTREREPKSLDEAYRTALRLEAYQRSNDNDDRRRQPNRVRSSQEVDPTFQLQSTLERFMASQREEQRRLREEQRKFQQEMKASVDRQLHELRATTSDRPGRDAPVNDEEQADTCGRGNSSRTGACFNCGRPGHYARDCRQRNRQGRDWPNGRATPGNAVPMSTGLDVDAVSVNHSTHMRVPNRATSNAVYIKGEINGRSRLCLIDTGSEVSLVPLSMVQGMTLNSCNRFLVAANGSGIRVLGEVKVPLRVRGNYEIPSTFLVSDQVVDPMLGMDWLREHGWRLGFGGGALFVGRRRLQLVRGNGSVWCRRVIVAQEVVVAPKCQLDVPVKTVYGNLSSIAPAWMTEAKELEPGVHLARVVVDDSAETTQVRIVNLTDGPVRLGKDRLLGGLHPVEIETKGKCDRSREPTGEVSPVDALMNDLPEEVTGDVRAQLRDLLEEYRDVLSVSELDLGRTTVTMHKIDTGDAPPVRQPLRRQPLPHRVVVDEQLDSMLKAGTVEPAVSEWAANVVLARKKDGTLRFCIDYRQLNERTRKDSYPLPRIDECLDALAGGGWFSTLDLRSGYHQVAMDPRDADKTAFVTRRGIYRGKVMPFGLFNAPATFQRLMDIVLSGLNFEMCLVYLDDVIIFGDTPEQHLLRLGKVFERLRAANLKLKPSKCRLMRRHVDFLGHVISQEGVSVDPSCGGLARSTTLERCPFLPWPLLLL